MAVRSDERLAGSREAFKVYLVADSVAGTGEADAVLFRHGLYVTVIVRVLKACLQGVVIYICYG